MEAALHADVQPLLPPLSKIQPRTERCVAAARSVARIPSDLKAGGSPDDVMFPFPFGSAYSDAVFRIVRWLPSAYIEMIMTGTFGPLSSDTHRNRPQDFQLIGKMLAKTWLAFLNPGFYYKGQSRYYCRAHRAFAAIESNDSATFKGWAGPALQELHDHFGTLGLDRQSPINVEIGLAMFAYVVVQTLMAVVDPTEATADTPDYAMSWNGNLDGRDLAAALYQLFQPVPDPCTCSVILHQFLSF